MRKELEEFEWHVYGIELRDFNHTYHLTKQIIDDRKELLNLQLKRLDPNSTKAEAIDDLVYYNDIENLYLWHFALWRLQGLFEGFLKQEFFPGVHVQGLAAKLKYVRNLSYTIDHKDFDALIKWGRIRNALSHFPPEKNRPGHLNEDDVKEYLQVILAVINNLKNQKEKRTTTPC